MELMMSLILAAGLAFIPANIAKKKGKSFGLWWFYGWMLFIVALIHSLLLPDPDAVQIGAADQIKKYKDLLDSGAITQQEFEEKKRQLMK